MDHYAPHSRAKFEGYYTRFSLPSGSSFVIVLCTIPNKQYLLTFIYVPADTNARIWQRNVWLDSIAFSSNDTGGFSMTGTSLTTSTSCSMNVKEGHVDYVLCIDDEVHFTASTFNRTPWSTRHSSPEGPFATLPLPLHWHVLSLASDCKYNATFPAEAGVPAAEEGAADCTAHLEKNWATGFPSAHMWVQARSRDTTTGKSKGICLAGGKILGGEAFLLGYRNEELGLEIDVRPPFALQFLGIAPFMKFFMNWEERKFEICVSDFSMKILVEAQAPKGSFFSFWAPYADGFKKNWMGESLQATVKVTVWEKKGGFLGLFGHWELICTDEFDRGGLEFGGEYYPLRGTEKEFN